MMMVMVMMVVVPPMVMMMVVVVVVMMVMVEQPLSQFVSAGRLSGPAGVIRPKGRNRVGHGIEQLLIARWRGDRGRLRSGGVCAADGRERGGSAEQADDFLIHSSSKASPRPSGDKARTHDEVPADVAARISWLRRPGEGGRRHA